MSPYRQSGMDSDKFAPRQQHRYPLLVTAVFVAKHIDEVALLEQDADEDVGGGHASEQDMPDGHHRRRPERNNEAEIDRVPYEIIQKRRPEDRRRHLPV